MHGWPATPTRTEGRPSCACRKEAALPVCRSRETGDSAVTFTTDNYGVETCSAIEWAFVAEPDAPPGGGGSWPGAGGGSAGSWPGAGSRPGAGR